MENACGLRVYLVAGAAALTGSDGTQGMDTTEASRPVDSQVVLSDGCAMYDFVVYSADLLKTGSPQKWAVGMNLKENSACMVKVDTPATVIILDNIGDTIDTKTPYGAAWLYGSSIYASTNEAKTPELQNVYKFANITVNSDQTSGTVRFVAVSKSAVTNNNDGLNCPVTASPFNTACPCGNCTKCYVAPPTTGVTATQLQFTTDPMGCNYGNACSSSAVITIQNFLGATVTTSTVTVTLTVKSGLGEMSGTTSVAAVGGIATFTDLSFSMTGAYVVTASITQGNDFLRAESGCISVNGPAGLKFTTMPSSSVKYSMYSSSRTCTAVLVPATSVATLGLRLGFGVLPAVSDATVVATSRHSGTGAVSSPLPLVNASGA